MINDSLFMKKPLRLLMVFFFLFSAIPTTGVSAQTASPVPLVSSRLFGLAIHPDNPLSLDFLIDSSDVNVGSMASHGTAVHELPLQNQSLQFINDFLTALALKDNEMWVNLSPLEPDRIIPELLGKTDMGRRMLEQDYLLKQRTSALLNPKTQEGRLFWDKVYEASSGDPNAPQDVKDFLHRVWIVPGSASIVVKGHQVFLVKSTLKVLTGDEKETFGHAADDKKVFVDVLKQHVIPVLEKEVNESEDFAPLRQIYQAVVLAVWYKTRLTKGTLHEAFAGQNHIQGLDTQSPETVRAVYESYAESFRQGLFSSISEEYDPRTQQTVLREYVTGGIDVAATSATIALAEPAMLNEFEQQLQDPQSYEISLLPSNEATADNDSAMLSKKPYYPFKQLKAPQKVKPLKPLMVAMSLMDVGAEMDENGELTYRDSLGKAGHIIDKLADSGVGTVYLYGGLHEMSDSSENLHSIPTPGNRFITPDDKHLIWVNRPYLTKSKILSAMAGLPVLKDIFRNSFSPKDDKLEINRRLGIQKDTPATLEKKIRKLTEQAARRGVDVIGDFVPELSPDAINETNYKWTKHIEFFDTQYKGIAIDDPAVKTLLRKNPEYFALKVRQGIVLVRHFYYDGDNRDQVYLNLFHPEVQDYYIRYFKTMIDRGFSGARIDLVKFLLRSELESEFGRQDAPDEVEYEPFYEVLTAVREYAESESKAFTFILESYDNNRDDQEEEGEEKIYLRKLCGKAGVSFKLYHKKFNERYHQFISPKKRSLTSFAHQLNEIIYDALKWTGARLGFLSNYDEPSLKDIGGPTDAATALLLAMTYSGAPVMIDLREWMRHSGHVISVPGGMDPDTKVITHSLVNAQEFQQRMRPEWWKELENSPWKNFLRTLQSLNNGGAELIYQEHPNYPYYLMDYVNPADRQQFITLGWRINGKLNLFVVNMSPGGLSRNIAIKLPPDLREKFGSDEVVVAVDGQQSHMLLQVSRSNGHLDIVQPFVAQADSMWAVDRLPQTLEYLQNHPEELDQTLAWAEYGQLSLPDGIKELLDRLRSFALTESDVNQIKFRGFLENSYQKLGAHPLEHDGNVLGTYFSVWAPNAKEVSVVGNFNEWNPSKNFLTFDPKSGVWQGFIPGVKPGDRYQFSVASNKGVVLKNDPMAFSSGYEKPFAIVADTAYEWSDQQWEQERLARQSLNAPVSIYQVDLGSWMQKSDESKGPGQYRKMTYTESAQALAAYVQEMNFTHVQLMLPTNQLYSPSSRYGTPQEFKYLVDLLHQKGIGVILEWNPVHFPDHAEGLTDFDGTSVYSRQTSVTLEGKKIYNFSKPEVKNYLTNNALYWIKEYHIDGLYVQGVDVMLEASPQRKKLALPKDSLEFFKDLNFWISRANPDILMFREGLGVNDFHDLHTGQADFTLKWNTRWAQQVLEYFSTLRTYFPYLKHFLQGAPVNDTFSNNFIFPLSHDFVKSGKSLIDQLSGDETQKFRGLKLLIAYMMTAPGKKLMFQGIEFGERGWDPQHSLPWHLLEQQTPEHLAMKAFTAEINRIYREEKSLHDLDFHHNGIQWIYKGEKDGVMAFMRRGLNDNEADIVLFNFSDISFDDSKPFKVGVPWEGEWREIINSDAVAFGGTGLVNENGVVASEGPKLGQPCNMSVRLPAKSFVIFKGVKAGEEGEAVEAPQHFRKQRDLNAAANKLYGTEVTGGVVDANVETTYAEGEEIVIRVAAHTENSKRKVYLRSNNYPDEQWRDEEVPFTFLNPKKVGGKAIYEYRIPKAERTFEYTVKFIEGKGNIKWAKKPEDNKNYKISVKHPFKGQTVYIASEFKAVVKKGGQGDVGYELPLAQVNLREALGVPEGVMGVTVIMPYYKAFKDKYDAKGFEDVEDLDITIPFPGWSPSLKVKTAMIDGIRVYALDAWNSDIFNDIYKSDESQFYHTVALSRGSLELLKRLGQPVDVINYADHHTGLVPLYMRTMYADVFKNTASVLTVHNGEYQGWYGPQYLDKLGFSPHDLEWIKPMILANNSINMMKVALKSIIAFGKDKNRYVTVSNSYLEEIKKYKIAGENLFAQAGGDGILNGLDFNIWNPATDKMIYRNYDINDGIDKVMAARAENKDNLQTILAEEGDSTVLRLSEPDKVYGSLAENKPDRLLIGAVGRLENQKQLDIIASMIEQMANGSRPPQEFDLVILASGEDESLTRRFIHLAQDPRVRALGINVCFINQYSDIAARRILSSADLILIPSDAEPCGLVQFQAWRYGALVGGRNTGGLGDTIREFGDRRNGFIFNGKRRVYDNKEKDKDPHDTNVYELSLMIGRASQVYYEQKERWKKTIESAMSEKNGWNEALWVYLDLYQKIHDAANRAMMNEGDAAVDRKTGGIDFDSKYLTWDEAQQMDVDWNESEASVSLNLENISGLVPVVTGRAPFDRSVLSR